jgi:hypothetical protein
MPYNVIKGDEPPHGDGGALDALIDFYRAFNSGDLAGLTRNWSQGDDPSMDNPIGGIRRGWEAIAQGYRRLFEGTATVHVEFFDFTSQGGPDHHLFVGRERGTCVFPSGSLDLRIRTSRLFVLIGNEWRQRHHHGSIEEPALLGAYQTLILGQPIVQTS